MRVIRDTKELQGIELAVTAGFFDGVHRGHRFLIERLQTMAAQRGLPTAVITFPQHPRKVLQADYQPKLLNSFPEKLEHLEETGIDYCILFDFTPELSRLTAEEFIRTILADQLHTKLLLVGYDHRFGHNRAEGVTEYIAYGKECGIEVVPGEELETGTSAVSSSEIRRQLLSGHVETAARLLTYPYQIKGHIVGGHQVGRKLGFPTANIRVDEPFKVIPAIGVYAVSVTLQDHVYAGMLYIGRRPTLNNGEDVTLEVNIFDFNEDIYNNEIGVSFMHYVRGDIRFDSLEALKDQLEKDRQAVKALMRG
ncbi:riboflavin biosynthesis protein RibF [Parabacteroides sp. OttesenSCG-928-B22]|uniref:riboflavin biosynthesis protein RibF n=1 Tax=unclassified Parabacteroides TaxID=2649774 RepID=UPI0024755888|nr:MULTISPECIES: riboflavin biosynthesis protein RibF [unclassified Parabacteroides]MDL2310099.1 riboflavin biosynthesis protein RibF [Parabacteroides sp. OttesenSCG-928-B22]